MTTQTDQTQLAIELTLRDKSGDGLTVRASVLSLIYQSDQITDCRLSLCVTPESYQRVDTNALFRLLPSVRGYLPEQAFQADLDIEITTKLYPALLPQLAGYQTAEEVANHLLHISRHQSDSPLLSTESWLALQVRQLLDSSEVGFRTFWAYADADIISQDAIADGRVFGEMERFFDQEWAEALPDMVAESMLAELLSELHQEADEWAELGDSTLAELSAAELIEEIAHELADETGDELLWPTVLDSPPQPVFQALLVFFQEDDWSFTKIKGQQTLRLAFQGDHGTWNCYASAVEGQQKAVFYSICPRIAPVKRRNAIAHFITLANHGLVIGNFELDFQSGEIRYKTSIDVTEDRLTSALLQPLVYTNVAMMDKYLPGILAITNDNCSPVDAFNLVEEGDVSR